MDLGLEGRRALVCGASRGLGAAIAEALAADGARTALVARSTGRLEQIAARLGGVAVPADLESETGPALAVERAGNALGGLDVLVVSGGGPPAGAFDELDDAAWRTAVDRTLLPVVRLLRHALPLLREGRDGAALVVLSSSVREPIPGLETSNVLRPGLAGLVKSLASQIAPVRINGLIPGRFATERVAELDRARAARQGIDVDAVALEATRRIPLGRYGDPAELGRVAAFLCSPVASYVTGANVAVDGGMARSLP